MYSQKNDFMHLLCVTDLSLWKQNKFVPQCRICRYN